MSGRFGAGCKQPIALGNRSCLIPVKPSLERSHLNLTPDQVAAARAIGCAFFPASELQVQRLTMQQRVFRVDGKPFLLSRDGSYFETIGTLLALIAAAPPALAKTPAEAFVREAVPEVVREATPAAPPPLEPPQSGEPAPAEAAPSAAPRKRGRPRKVAAASTTARAEPQPEAPPEPETASEAMAAPSPVESPSPASSAAPIEGARGSRLARLARRRAGTPPPKWQTAGPARRGRLKRF
jgi:hypothetical protein